MLTGWIFETRHVVQVVVIEHGVDGRKRRFDIGEIHHPSCGVTDWPGHMHFNAKRMSVDATTLMASGYVRQAMRRLEREFFENVHATKGTADEILCAPIVAGHDAMHELVEQRHSKSRISVIRTPDHSF